MAVRTLTRAREDMERRCLVLSAAIPVRLQLDLKWKACRDGELWGSSEDKHADGVREEGKTDCPPLEAEVNIQQSI